jgi:hypothetical protein
VFIVDLINEVHKEFILLICFHGLLFTLFLITEVQRLILFFQLMDSITQLFVRLHPCCLLTSNAAVVYGFY